MDDQSQLYKCAFLRLVLEELPPTFFHRAEQDNHRFSLDMEFGNLHIDNIQVLQTYPYQKYEIMFPTLAYRKKRLVQDRWIRFSQVLLMSFVFHLSSTYSYNQNIKNHIPLYFYKNIHKKDLLYLNKCSNMPVDLAVIVYHLVLDQE